VVTDEVYEAALADPNNRRIIGAAQRPFRAKLSTHELKSAGLVALWRALLSHKNGFKTKFTSSLFRFVVWECLQAVKEKARLESGDTLFASRPRPDRQESLDFLLDGLVEADRQLLRDYVANDCNQSALARHYGIPRGTVRNRVRRALASLRCIFDLGNTIGEKPCPTSLPAAPTATA
jgi:DNA-directed RNA polymerase specialized sigma24 family protein